MLFAERTHPDTPLNGNGRTEKKLKKNTADFTLVTRKEGVRLMRSGDTK